MEKYILYFGSIILLFNGQIFNVIGSFISVPYTQITFWEAYTMSIPYVFIQRILCNIAIYYIDTYKFFTNNQLVMMLLLMQFGITLLITLFYLKQSVGFSDYIGIFILCIAYYISYFRSITRYYYTTTVKII